MTPIHLAQSGVYVEQGLVNGCLHAILCDMLGTIFNPSLTDCLKTSPPVSPSPFQGEGEGLISKGRSPFGLPFLDNLLRILYAW